MGKTSEQVLNANGKPVTVAETIAHYKKVENKLLQKIQELLKENRDLRRQIQKREQRLDIRDCPSRSTYSNITPDVQKPEFDGHVDRLVSELSRAYPTPASSMCEQEKEKGTNEDGEG
ncbi:hypothetical protein Y032_0010g928 [Ancylostoma ceylanicum]|uniref:Uncharacterized protein n=1 Tax=Ancylostoma ceylanicum TaxID=53326 RepID=A0A016VGG5_9BILA|nr:hypothetical protein Y032_0010g928 [Ancylostoma ceylanicum]